MLRNTRVFIREEGSEINKIASFTPIKNVFSLIEKKNIYSVFVNDFHYLILARI